MVWILLLGIIILLAMADYFLAQKRIVEILIPLALLLLADAALLYAKFISYSWLLTMLFYLPIAGLIFITLIIIIVKFIRNNKSDNPMNKRQKQVLLFNVILVFAIFMLPFWQLQDRYFLYQRDYEQAATSVQSAYDKGLFDQGEKGSSYLLSYPWDMDELEEKTSKETAKQLKKLRTMMGVNKLIIADKAVYFQFGATFHSVDGIVVFTNTEEREPDEEFIVQYIQAPRFKKITESVYYYDGGL